LVRWVPVRGRRCRVAAEHFAIAADVHRWLDRIGDDDYTCETPDGRGRSRPESGARLARMVCIDADRLGPEGVTAIAAHIARAQLQQIGAGLRQVTRRLGDACPSTVVVSGQGSALAREAGLNVGLVPRDLADELGLAVSRTAPASAVAWLLTEKADA
jgi:probable H4MPT-linked C1 transfer pathway protein